MPQPERRIYAGSTAKFNRRAKDAAPDADYPGDNNGPGVITGHASVFNQWTTLYQGRYWTWREIVRPGAFARALKQKQDVRGLFNHDANLILGRTTSGTMQLSEDKVGLATRIVPPNSQMVNDLVLEPMERGDISGMSFAFLPRVAAEVKRTETKEQTVVDRGGDRTTLRYEGDMLIEETELLDLDLFDASVVTYPQYEGSECEINGRSIVDLRELITRKDVPHLKTPNLDHVRKQLEARASVARAK